MLGCTASNHQLEPSPQATAWMLNGHAVKCYVPLTNDGIDKQKAAIGQLFATCYLTVETWWFGKLALTFCASTAEAKTLTRSPGI